ncbi:MAG: hypothetical protein HUU02_08965 [Bacteroidetes bacterium]|nr:hypothetical protein [Bacteroidota bacterium]
MQHEFRYKLDFYYQQALIYLLTFILYAGVKGTFVEDNFTLVFGDPILTIIGFFVLTSFVTLLLNRVRDRKVIVTDREIVFQHRFNRRAVTVEDIEWIHIGKERLVRTAGRSQVVVIKAKHRRRAYRIRLGRYERERELLKMLEQIAEQTPRRKERFPFRK